MTDKDPGVFADIRVTGTFAGPGEAAGLAGENFRKATTVPYGPPHQGWQCVMGAWKLLCGFIPLVVNLLVLRLKLNFDRILSHFIASLFDISAIRGANPSDLPTGL